MCLHKFMFTAILKILQTQTLQRFVVDFRFFQSRIISLYLLYFWLVAIKNKCQHATSNLPSLQNLVQFYFNFMLLVKTWSLFLFIWRRMQSHPAVALKGRNQDQLTNRFQADMQWQMKEGKPRKDLLKRKEKWPGLKLRNANLKKRRRENRFSCRLQMTDKWEN